MKYTQGRAGRIFVARFEDREEILKNLQELAKKENIRAGVFYLLGGVRKGRIVVGPERDELPPKPIWKDIRDNNEVIAIGSIFWQAEEPKIHLHGAFGRGDNVSVGCLREAGEVFLVLEAIIIEIEGIRAEREFDPATGLTLLKIG
ncbi:MAG: DUF296 domain-containing protein [Thermodesulfovibrionales bacterium]|nr:DUF296 domain-containing protein [Thermodesulfovibrionales bacterium]